MLKILIANHLQNIQANQIRDKGKESLMRLTKLSGFMLCLGLVLILPTQIGWAQTVDSEEIETQPSSEPESEPESESNAGPEADPINVEPPAAESPLSFLNTFNSPFSQQNFVPDIALILDLSGGWRNLANQAYADLASPLQAAVGEQEAAINAHNGFNLNYAELTLQSPADPFFDLFAAFHLSPEGFEIEEAYFSTRGLPGNLQVKAGKFLSHFGRINNQHEHFWNFNQRPLIYNDFLGAESLNEIGAQLNWVAPTDFFLNLGLEVLQGTNGSSFGNSAINVGSQNLSEINGPNLAVAYAKTSVDLGEQVVLLGGLSYAQGGSRQTLANEEAFAGGTRLYGADMTLRWFIDSYREMFWQTEFLHRSLDGNHYTATGQSSLNKEQSGLYSEWVWRFAWQWRAGVRLDLITLNDTWDAGQLQSGPALLPRYAAILEYHPSEFSRLRLEYSYDLSRLADGAQSPVQSLFLNLNLAMGAHGAHTF
jgi:hypothetical protein